MANKMRIHLLIGKKDADIAYWKQYLGKGYFTTYVERMLRAELKKKTVMVPVPESEGLFEKRMDATLILTDRLVIERLGNLPKGKRGAYIRRVIRKNLAVNFKRNSQRIIGSQDEEKMRVSDEDKSIESVVAIPKEESESVHSTATEKKSMDDFRAQIARMNNR